MSSDNPNLFPKASLHFLIIVLHASISNIRSTCVNWVNDFFNENHRGYFRELPLNSLSRFLHFAEFFSKTNRTIFFIFYDEKGKTIILKCHIYIKYGSINYKQLKTIK